MEKEKDTNLFLKRKQLQDLYSNTVFKSMKTINAIAIKAKNNPTAEFDNLIELISDEGILYQAIGKISKKEGALTPGPSMDKTTVDATSIDLIRKIAKEIKQGTFKFKPIRRIYMDKSGKKPITAEQKDKLRALHQRGQVTMDEIKELKARPLGISSFPDKIVQEAIRLVLNAIYEPEFARQNVNFGFRQGYGCADAIQQITIKTKQMDYAIEGDMKGAYDNVVHEILIKILRKKIKDDRFLKLIFGGLKCGVMYLQFTQETDIGTGQGSVVSPLLYNIYFNEFDNFINNDFKSIIEKINSTENRTDRPINKLYNSISKKKTKLQLTKKIKEIEDYKKTKDFNFNNLINLQMEKKEKLKQYKILDKIQKKIPAFAKSRQTIRYTYYRYADDWVLFTNADKNRVLEWKNLFAEWIDNNLKLKLSMEKTKITDLRRCEPVKFLGYQLRREKKRTFRNLINVGVIEKKRIDIVNRTKTKKIKITNPSRIYKTRGANPALIVTWDKERVLQRMESNGFIKKEKNTYRGKSKLQWTVLEEPEIIERYNSIIRGYLAYYTPVSSYPTGILFLFYLLKYSCAHTLAQKRNTSLRKIFKKYGKNIKIKFKEKTELINKEGTKIITEKNKTVDLISWEKCKTIIRELLIRTRQKQKEKANISIIDKAIDDICNIKINWRTAYKLTKYCAVCGSTEKVEYHHVKHIKKGKVTGFLQIMKQLNRKQIPCCANCHKKIHKGEYDGLSLRELYDEELIII